MCKSIDACNAILLEEGGDDISSIENESESDSKDQPKEILQDQGLEHKADPSPIKMGIQYVEDETPSKSLAVTKKWVCGRLVEVVEEIH